MYTNPKTASCADFIIMESNIDKIFIDALNKKIDELRLHKNKTSASDTLVGQIKKGEQLILNRKIKIFDQVHKLGEIMAEKYTSEFLLRLALKIYIQEQNVQVCGRFINFLAIITQCTVMQPEKLDCHLFFGQKFLKI